MMLEIFNFLHFIGLAFGLAGATIAVMIMRKANKDKDVGLAAAKIVPSISKLIWLGFILLVISGIGISFLAEWPINKQILLVKHVLVAWIFVFGVIIGFKIKKMQKLTPKPKEKPSLNFLRIKKQVESLGFISLILWYAITLLSVFV